MTDGISTTEVQSTTAVSADVFLDVTICSLRALLGSPGFERTIAAMGDHLWVEWSDDFKFFLNLVTPRSVVEFIKSLYGGGDHAHTTFVAFDSFSKQFIGAVSVRPSIVDWGEDIESESPTSPEFVWLSNMYVVPHYRNHGVGRTLCKHALDFVRCSVDVDRVFLWTCNDDVLAWYARRFGFRTHATVVNYGHHRAITIAALDVRLPREAWRAGGPLCDIDDSCLHLYSENDAAAVRRSHSFRVRAPEAQDVSVSQDLSAIEA